MAFRDCLNAVENSPDQSPWRAMNASLRAPEGGPDPPRDVPARTLAARCPRYMVGMRDRRRLEVWMEAHNGELGPIDIVVIAYPAGAPMTGEAAPLLVDLVDRGIIRVLDAMFVKKNEDGTFSGFDARDLDDKGVGDFTVFDGASSGLLSDEDAAKAAEAIEPGSAAVMIVYENRWAAPFVAAVRRNGGVAVAFERVPAQGLLDALDAAEAAS